MKNRSRKDCALLVLRLVAGIIFMIHGYGKLFGNAPGMEMFTGMVAGLGFPAAGAFAYMAALTEFLGGLALILGVGVRIASVLLAIVMLVAFIGVKKLGLPAGDPDLALLAIVVALGLMGPGRYSVMGMLRKGNGDSCNCNGCNCTHGEAMKNGQKV
ncbi:MAG: DoxX family protein [Patescibacteria group bacterium]